MTPIQSAKYSESVISKAPHFHDCHQLLYICEGKAQITINEKTYTVANNTLVLISRLEMHSIKVISPEYKRFEIRVSPDFFFKKENPQLYSALINRPVGFSHTITPKNAKILEAIQSIVTEANSHNIKRDEMLKLLFEVFLIELLRSEPQLFAEKDRKTEIVHQISLEFEENLSKQYSLKEIAKEKHLSEYYLSHIFKEITGYSVMGYLLSLRLATAKKLLTQTKLSINEIINECGFSDNSNFSRTFKSATNLSPSNFRKLYYHEH